MYQIPEDNRFAFIIFVKENNYWDDIPTAVILFMEETNKEV
jgi:predicted neutral ceramidase superfamily lipid hydrolase